MLSLVEIEKTYETGDQALRGVSMEVTGREVVAIIGPSGAGKSTLIRCINRLTEPSNGRIELDGIEITSLSKRELKKERRNMGMIFQEYGLVERLTVMDKCFRAGSATFRAGTPFAGIFPTKTFATPARRLIASVSLGWKTNAPTSFQGDSASVLASHARWYSA